MKLGKMRYRITIESPVNIADDDGFNQETYIEFATVWADITPVSSKEYFDSNQTVEEATSKIYIRHIAGINTLMRIRSGSRLFDIISVLSDDRLGMTTIIAREVYADGQNEL